VKQLARREDEARYTIHIGTNGPEADWPPLMSKSAWPVWVGQKPRISRSAIKVRIMYIMLN
jgi:hypothetical protein